MATELRFTVWTSSSLDPDVAHVIARTLTSAVRANGDTEAAVVAVEVTPVQPADIDALEREAKIAEFQEAIAAAVAAVTDDDLADPDALEDEDGNPLIGESGYPLADEGDETEEQD